MSDERSSDCWDCREVPCSRDLPPFAPHENRHLPGRSRGDSAARGHQRLAPDAVRSSDCVHPTRIAMAVSSESVVSLPNTAPAQTAAAEQSRWFTEEVQPHEESLRSYLKGSFPTVRDVDDVVQESYLRLWRARSAHPIRCARAYLFGIAHRFAVDVIRREIRASSHNVVMDPAALNVLEGTADAAEAASAKEEIALLAEAIHSLPARCREIVIMRKLDQLSHQEIARRLGISASTVEVQIYRGMEKCTRYLRSRQVAVGPRGSSP